MNWPILIGEVSAGLVSSGVIGRALFARRRRRLASEASAQAAAQEALAVVKAKEEEQVVFERIVTFAFAEHAVFRVEHAVKKWTDLHDMESIVHRIHTIYAREGRKLPADWRERLSMLVTKRGG